MWKNLGTAYSVKPRRTLCLCLKYLRNHQWSPWKQLSSGSLRSYEGAKPGYLDNPLQNKTSKCSVVRNVAVCMGRDQLCSQELFLPWQSGSLTGKRGEVCKVPSVKPPSFCNLTELNSNYLPGGLQGDTVHTSRKACPWTVPLNYPCSWQSTLTTGAGHLLWLYQASDGFPGPNLQPAHCSLDPKVCSL